MNDSVFYVGSYLIGLHWEVAGLKGAGEFSWGARCPEGLNVYVIGLNELTTKFVANEVCGELERNEPVVFIRFSTD